MDYGIFIYFHNLKQSEIHRIEQIQYKAGQVVTGALPLTSMLKLNIELGWESIAERAKFLGLTFFHKIHMQLKGPLIRTCMPKPNLNQHYKFRDNGTYILFPHYNLQCFKILFPYFTNKEKT